MLRTMAVAACALTMMTVGALAEGCDLPNGKWSCEEKTATKVDLSYKRSGKSGMCQVFEVVTTTTTYTAVNPGGKENADHSGEPVVTTSDPVKAAGGNVPCPAGTP